MENETIVAAMLTRRSVSPKRSALPALSQEALYAIMGTALVKLRDHAELVPWRVIDFPPESREAQADLFAAEKLRRDPIASSDAVVRAREHAIHAPAILAFVVKPKRHLLVPVHEQWLSAGAALGNILTTAHLLGLGAIMLSGERCQDEPLRVALNIGADEVLAGFISIGSIAKPAPATARAPHERSLVELVAG